MAGWKWTDVKSIPRATCGSACLPQRKVSNLLLSLVLFAWVFQVQASEVTVQALLDAPSPPAGVVIEIVETVEGDLQTIWPEIEGAITRLKARFPELDIAIVTHGGEQFALQQKRIEEYPRLHQRVRTLSESGTPVHVCGAHAGWYGANPEDFPEYVDVSPSGPRQIKDYLDLGYRLLKISLD